MKKTISVLLFVLVYSFNSNAGVLDSLGVIQNDNETLVQYMVSPGETIYRISTKYGVSISELMEINPDLENGLKVGQILDIPYRPDNLQPKQTTNLPAGSVHEVQPGETLYALSKKYNVSVGDLLKWNGMELKAGQSLIVQNPNPSLLPPKKEEKEEPIKQISGVAKKEVTTSNSSVNSSKEQTSVVYSNPEAPTRAEESLENQANAIVNDVDPHSEKYHYNPNLKQVMIIPFDPHLYFSDADDEIAQESEIPRVHVREIFRRRLNALIDPKGYEVLHLMGGRFKDTLTDLNKIYSSVRYNYQEVLKSPYNTVVTVDNSEQDQKTKEGLGGWINRQKDKLKTSETENSKASTDRFEGKFFGVVVDDPNFFTYFDEKYSVDYYVFINQFEVVTDYENCLDRSAHNYARYFIAHYTIMDKDGNPIAGNKFKVFYDSSNNDIMKITADNMGQIAQQILNDLPKPDEY